MHVRFFVLLFFACATISAFAAQNDQSPSSEGITEPALLPGAAPAPAQKCGKKHSEEVDFDVLINSSGYPAQYYFRSVRGNEADLIALRTVANDHFSPAMRGGAAIQVMRTVAVDMELYVEKHKESDGTKTESLALAAPPQQRVFRSADLSAGEVEIQSGVPDAGKPYKIGGSITPPKPLFTPAATYTKEARKAHKQGTCMIRLIVDQHGAPENLQVLQPLGDGLDEKAEDAVQHYRFRPAMKNGQIAVPVFLTIEVTFRLY